MEKNVFIIMPEKNVFYGYVVDKDTKLEFKNNYVDQKLENLQLISKVEMEVEGEFKQTSETTIYLKEGDKVLLEEEGRGLFKPKDVTLATVDEARREWDFFMGECEKIDKE